MSAARHIQFWFEFASTYSYPAAMRIETLCRQRDVAIACKPFLLGPIFAAQGWSDSPFNLYPAKGRYMWRDLERLCADLSLPFRRPSRFPRSGLLAARVACANTQELWLPTFVRAVYTANFAEDREIADADVITGILNRLDLPGVDLVDRAGAKDSKARLRANTEEAVALGIFGAPSFIVDGELFWGNDRLEMALDHCLAADGRSPADAPF